MSLFDRVYRRTVAFDFFTKGWGRPELLLQLIQNMENVRGSPTYIRDNTTYRPIMIEKKNQFKKLVEIEGSFVSPLEDLLNNAMCANNRISRFQLVAPKTWKSDFHPICIHFAGTGDHTYYRRRVFLANQLLEDGIASLIIMNPFYGLRKPVDQKGSGLNYLSDLFVMGGSLILECHTLLRWCEQQGFGPFAFHGISMGGYMATICATTVRRSVSLIPCLSWTSASVVFLEGVLADSVDWRTLTKQYLEDSVYSKVIRARIQPSIRPIYQYQHAKNSAQKSACTEPSSNSHVPTESALQSNLQDMKPSPASPAEICTSQAPSLLLLSRALPQVSQFSDASHQAPSHNSFNPFGRLSTNDISRLWSYLKAHNKLYLFLNNSNVLDTAVSALRHVPESIFPPAEKPDPEVREFLRELLDYFTHLGNFPAVSDARLITSVTAGRDAYVPRDGVVPFDVVFPNSDIRYLPQSGHVSAYVRNAIWNQDFRQAICDTLNRQMVLYHGAISPTFGKPPNKRGKFWCW